MFFFCHNILKIKNMDVLILSNNRFSGFNKNPRLLYVTDGDCKIKSFGNLHNNTMFNFHINRQVFYPVSQNFNSFTKVSDTEYKVTVHGFSFYLIGLIYVSGPCTIKIDFTDVNTSNIDDNITYNILTIPITKECTYYISEHTDKRGSGDWSDNSYFTCYVESGDATIDCSKLFRINWII